MFQSVIGPFDAINASKHFLIDQLVKFFLLNGQKLQSICSVKWIPPVVRCISLLLKQSAVICIYLICNIFVYKYNICIYTNKT